MISERRLITVQGVADPGMLDPVARGLVDRKHYTEWVKFDWKAEYGPVPRIHGKPFEVSTNQGLYELQQKIDEKPRTPTALAGYSAGALVVHRYCESPADNVFAAALLADPLQPQLLDVPYWGLAGRGGKIPRVEAQWWWDPKDAIAFSHRDSPLRALATVSAGMSLGDPAYFSKSQAAKMSRNAIAGLIQFWRDPTAATRYGEAAENIMGYIPPPIGRGDHTSYGTRITHGGKTYLQSIADWLQSRAWKYEGVL